MKKYIVRLTEAQRQDLQHLISTGKESARRLMHARIVLKADQGAHGLGWTDAQISEALEVSKPTIVRVRHVCAVQGLDAALNRRKPRRTRPRRLDGAQEAHLIALACSAPPDGRDPGVCGCWPIASSRWKRWTRSATRPCAKCLKKRAQAVAKAAVVHPTGSECRICLRDGGHSGRVHATR